jgi:hypothetical protein
VNKISMSLGLQNSHYTIFVVESRSFFLSIQQAKFLLR